jgi:fibronectin type 3 domain-containing protein
LPVLTVSLASELGFNGTDEDLIGSFTYSDDDSDTINNNQTKWFKDNIEQTNLADLTQLSYTNTSAGDVWIFSARAHDGEEWGNWYNASITILDISQTYPTLVSPANGTYFNVSNVVLTYRTPNYADMNCTIYADTSSNPTTQIKNNTNIGARTTVIYNWINIADNQYNWKVSCINETTMLNSTIKSFTVDTTYPTTAPTLTPAGVSDSDKDGNIELSWAADPNATTYNIYRSSTEILDATQLTKIHTTPLTSWEDNTTLHNNIYWYALTTVDAAGNENRSIVSDSFNTTANDTIKPKIPINLNASSLNGVTTLYWTKTKQDINGNSDEFNLQYKIWYRQNSTVNLSKTLVNETADYIKTIAQCSATLCQTTHSLSGSTKYYYFITTIDDANNENLTLDNNFVNVIITTAPPSNTGGGGGGGGGGSTTKKECKEEWSCSGWYSCINNIQARTCVDINNCRTNINKPKETRACGACIEKWQCGDWTPCVNNRQTKVCIDKNECGTEINKPEEEQDCMLDTCSDGIKNYGEVGIDCGGPCKPCKASDFITGRAIALKATKGPNPFLLIPTIILLITFIVIKTIRKSDVKFRKVVSALHVPMIILIGALFIFSFFGPQITGLLVADDETINEDLDYEKNEQQIEDVSIFEFDKTKAKIASAIFLVIISIALVGLIIKRRLPTEKEVKEEEEPEKAKEEPQVEEQELPLDTTEEKVPTPETEEEVPIPEIEKEPEPKEEEEKPEIKEESKVKEQELPIQEIKDIEIEIDLLKEQEKKLKWEIYKEKQDKNKQEILNQLKEAYSK